MDRLPLSRRSRQAGQKLKTAWRPARLAIAAARRLHLRAARNIGRAKIETSANLSAGKPI
jgi:hypothetical protein